MDIKGKLASYTLQAAQDLGAKKGQLRVEVSAPRKPGEWKTTGDLSSSAPFQLAKIIKKNPFETAKELVKKLPKMPEIERAEAVPPGYINFWLSPKYISGQLDEILGKKDLYGSSKAGKGKRVLTEFISANPTGPLTLANARGGFLGDSLSRILEFSGYKVTREYYMNDSAYHNTQIQMLGRSVLAELKILESDKDKQYSGEYIDEVAGEVLKREPGLKVGKDIFLAGTLAAEIIMERFIAPSIARMGIEYDMFTHENKFYEDGSVQNAAEEWTKKGLAYEKDGALWFRTSMFGADEDAVVRRSTGEYTYLAADIVHYLTNIRQGRFAELINVVGADHHGTAKNLLAALKAFEVEEARIIIVQFVRLTSSGKEVKMSKRAGTFVTIEELLDEVGPDVARFFFLLRSPDSHMDFDLDLAREQSSKNPVFYVQYAHARISGILRNAPRLPQNPDWSLLKSDEEQNLIRVLLRFPEVILESVQNLSPHTAAHYSIKLADLFHPFYDTRRVIIADKPLANARLGLVLAVKYVLASSLNLLGVNAPEEM